LNDVITLIQQRVGNWQLLLALESGAKRFPRDERHCIVEQAVRISRVEQRENVRVLELRRGADLAEETLSTQDRPQIGMEHLHGDIAVVPDIVRQINGRHAALPDLVIDAVAIGQRFG